MRRRSVPTTVLLLALVFLFQCRKTAHPGPEVWYQTLRSGIQTRADLQADTTHFQYLADSAFSHRVFIHNGRVFREEWYGRSGDLQGRSLFTPDGKFEWRCEICPDGSIGFEGILFKQKFYGPCIWWYCDGRMRQHGYRFAGREIGIWRRWDEAGVLVDSIDRGGAALLDSLEGVSGW